MATPIIMPRQGQSVESCIIAKWHKQKGDEVKEGDVLFTYETDKATFDEESKVQGTLLEVFFEEGDDVPVLTNVCVIGNAGESTNEFKPGAEEDEKPGAEESKQAVEESAVKQEEAVIYTGTSGDGDRIKVSPRAKNLAEKSGVDYRYAEGTGPQGRIIERDVINLRENGPVFTASAREAFEAQGAGQIPVGTGLGGRITTGDLANIPAAAGQATEASEAEYTEVKLTNIRKVIAKAMHHSLSSTAQLTLNMSFDATDILSYRKKLKADGEKLGLGNITINDIILYAVSRAILNHKELNAHFLDDKMVLFNNVHLGVAVDTARGLMVPTIFNANKKSLNELSWEIKLLADQCKKGTINPDILRGGSFTVTNLGGLGVESFTPILNPPQTGILGVNSIEYRVKKVGNQYVNYPAMNLSLTFDHRAVDGAPAARFLKDLEGSLESFSMLITE